MTVTVAMHARSHAHIGSRLDALGLDLNVLTFDDTGQFDLDVARLAPGEVEVDYVWLSSHISSGPGVDRAKAKDTAFDTVLACRRVAVLQTFNAGLDDPFYRRAADQGIRICNSSAQGVAIAEYVFAQVLAHFHPIGQQRQMQADRTWAKTPFREISGGHWLIIGFGAIGQEVARRAGAFGATVTAVRRSPVPSDLAARVGTQSDLPQMLPNADVVVLACALNDTTRGLVGPEFLAAMKEDAVLVNIARGEVVDASALVAALDAGRPGTAILDVFATEPLPPEDPLWAHPKATITPHTSFAGSGVQARWDQLFLDNIQRYAKGQPLIREVDPSDV